MKYATSLIVYYLSQMNASLRFKMVVNFDEITQLVTRLFDQKKCLFSSLYFVDNLYPNKQQILDIPDFNYFY